MEGSFKKVFQCIFFIFVLVIFYWSLLQIRIFSSDHVPQGGVLGKGHGQGSRVCPCTGPSSVVLAQLHMFEILLRKVVVEKFVSCQHGRNSSSASFLHLDIFVVIPLVTSLKYSSSAFRGKILPHIQIGSSPVLTLKFMSFFFTDTSDTILESWVSAVFQYFLLW